MAGEHVPPQRVRAAARQGLEMHKRGEAGDGLESATVTRARKIAAGDALTDAHVKRMHSFFERHDKTRPDDGGRGKSPWRTAWMLWGGDSGRRWAASVVKNMQETAWLTGRGFAIVESTDGMTVELNESTMGRVFRSLRHFREDQPRWPRGAPHGKGGQWMQVGERFTWNGHLFEIVSIQGKRVTAQRADGGPRPAEVILTSDEQRDAVPVAPTPDYDMEVINRRVGGWATGQSRVPTVSAHPDPDTHDPTLQAPDWLSDEEWQQFGKADQLHLLRLEDRFGEVWSEMSYSGIEQLLATLRADYSDAAVHAVTHALDTQYDASTGNTLNLAAQDLSPADYEEARLLFRDCAEGLQYHLYRKLRTPDLTVFHGWGSSSKSSDEIHELLMSERVPLMSGLSCTGVFDVGVRWGPTVVAFPMAIRHVEMATDIGGFYLNHEDEHEVASSHRMVLDPEQSIVFTAGQGDIPNIIERFLYQECNEDEIYAPGQVIRDAIAAIGDPDATLPLPSEAPELTEHLGPVSTGGKPVLIDAIEVAQKAKPRGKKLRNAQEVVQDMKPGELFERVGPDARPGDRITAADVSLLPDDSLITMPDSRLGRRWRLARPVGGGRRQLELMDFAPRVIDGDELAALPTGSVVHAQVPLTGDLKTMKGVPASAQLTVDNGTDVVPVYSGEIGNTVFLTRAGMKGRSNEGQMADAPEVVSVAEFMGSEDLQAELEAVRESGKTIHMTVEATKLSDGSFGLRGVAGDGSSLEGVTVDASALSAMADRLATTGNGLVPVAGQRIHPDSATPFGVDILPSLPAGTRFTHNGRQWVMSEDQKTATEVMPVMGEQITEEWLRADTAPDGFVIECDLMSGHTIYTLKRVDGKWRVEASGNDEPAEETHPDDVTDGDTVVLTDEKAAEAKIGTRLLDGLHLYQKIGHNRWVDEGGDTLTNSQMGDDRPHVILQWPSEDRFDMHDPLPRGEEPPLLLLSPDDKASIGREGSNEDKKQAFDAIKRRLERLPEGTKLVFADAEDEPSRVVVDGKFVFLDDTKIPDAKEGAFPPATAEQMATSMALLFTEDRTTRFVVRAPELLDGEALSGTELADRYGGAKVDMGGTITTPLTSALPLGLDVTREQVPVDDFADGAIRVMGFTNLPLLRKSTEVMELESFPEGYDPATEFQRFVKLPEGRIVRVDPSVLDLPSVDVNDEGEIVGDSALPLIDALRAVKERGVTVVTYEGARFQSVWSGGGIQWELIEEPPAVDYGETNLSVEDGQKLIVRTPALPELIGLTEGVVDLRYETPWATTPLYTLTSEEGDRYRRLTRSVTLDSPDRSFVPMSRGEQAALTPVGKPRFLTSFPEGALVRLDRKVYRVVGPDMADTSERVELESVSTGLRVTANDLTRTCALEVGSHVITADSPPEPGTQIIVTTDSGTAIGITRGVSRGRVSVQLLDGEELQVKLSDCAGLPGSYASPEDVQVGDEFLLDGGQYRVTGLSDTEIMAEPAFNPATGQSRLGDVRAFPREGFAPTTHWRPRDWAASAETLGTSDIRNLLAGQLVVATQLGEGAPVYRVCRTSPSVLGQSLDTGEIVDLFEMGTLRLLVTKQAAGSDELEVLPSAPVRPTGDIVLRKQGAVIPEPTSRVAGGEITGGVDSRYSLLYELPMYARVTLRDTDGNVVKTFAKVRNEGVGGRSVSFEATDGFAGPYGSRAVEVFREMDLAKSATAGFSLHVEPHDGTLSPILGRTFEDLTDGNATKEAIRSVLSDLTEGQEIAEYDRAGDMTVYDRQFNPHGVELGWVTVGGAWMDDARMAEIIALAPQEHRVRPTPARRGNSDPDLLAARRVAASPELMDAAPIGTEVEVSVTGARVIKVRDPETDEAHWMTEVQPMPRRSSSVETVYLDDSQVIDWLMGYGVYALDDPQVGDKFVDADGDSYVIEAIPEDPEDKVIRIAGGSLYSPSEIANYTPIEVTRVSPAVPESSPSESRFERYRFVEGEPVTISEWPSGTSRLTTLDAPVGSTLRGPDGEVLVRTGNGWVVPGVPDESLSDSDVLEVIRLGGGDMTAWSITRDASGLGLLRSATRSSVEIPARGETVSASRSLLDVAPVGTVLERDGIRVRKGEANWVDADSGRLVSREDHLEVGADYTVVDWPDIPAELTAVNQTLIGQLPRLEVIGASGAEFVGGKDIVVTPEWDDLMPLGTIVSLTAEGRMNPESRGGGVVPHKIRYAAVKTSRGEWTFTLDTPDEVREAFGQAVLDPDAAEIEVRQVRSMSDLPTPSVGYEKELQTLIARAFALADEGSRIKLHSTESEIGAHPPGTTLHLVKAGGAWREATAASPHIPVSLSSEANTLDISRLLAKRDIRDDSYFDARLSDKAVPAHSIREGALAEDGEGNLWKIKASGRDTRNGSVVVTDGHRNYRLPADTLLVERTDGTNSEGEITAPVTSKAPFVDESPSFDDEPAASLPRVWNSTEVPRLTEGEQLVTREALMTRLPLMPVGTVLTSADGVEYRLHRNTVDTVSGAWLISRDALWQRGEDRLDTAAISPALPFTLTEIGSGEIEPDDTRLVTVPDVGTVFEYDEEEDFDPFVRDELLDQMMTLPVGTVLQDRDGDRYRVATEATSPNDKVLQRTTSGGVTEGGPYWSFAVLLDYSPEIVSIPGVGSSETGYEVGQEVLAELPLIASAPQGTVLATGGGVKWTKNGSNWVSPDGSATEAQMADGMPHTVVKWGGGVGTDAGVGVGDDTGYLTYDVMETLGIGTQLEDEDGLIWTREEDEGGEQMWSSDEEFRYGSQMVNGTYTVVALA